MGIVLREKEWTENMINSRSLGKKPSETLRRIARYYLDQGYNKRETRDMLDDFLLKCDSSASLPKWSNALDSAVNKATKYKSVEIESIDITVDEMERIKALPGKQVRRLAFTLLCLAKYWNIIAPQNDYWCHNMDNEIMAFANINTSIKRQSLLYKQIFDAGMIQFSRKVDNTSVRVSFAEDSGDVAMKITDLRNLGYQFLKYCGEPYMECQNCGIVTKIANPIKGMKQKYCKSCAIEVKMKQNVNSVMRLRNKQAVAI